MEHNVKWTEVLDGDFPVTQVAGKTVSERLMIANEYLTLAVEHPFANIEHVHQLRVATRRADAALDFFHDSFKVKKVVWFKKQLRRLRRAAGHARDLDVLIDRMTKRKKKQKKKSKRKRHRGPADLANLAIRQRRQAQKPLSDLQKQLKKKSFKKRSKRIADEAKWNGKSTEPSFAVAARLHLSLLVDKFFEAAAGDLSDIETLHEMRIQGKKLRYGMELVAAAFNRAFRDELYPTFKKVQNRIGIINDVATAKNLLSAWEPRSDKPLGGVLTQSVSREDRKAQRKIAEFTKWWTQKRSDLLRQQFDAAIASQSEWDGDSRSCVDPRV
ncbi:CHAD domain-containing protein [Planctomycetota bacterium]